MDCTRFAAELMAQEEFPGFALHPRDAWLVCDGACWLVAERTGETIVGRVDEDSSRVLTRQRRWPSPRPGPGHGFASPLPDGGLAVSGRDAITVYDADGWVRWTYSHDAWPGEGNIGSGACVADASGRLLLATVSGPAEPGSYPGDLCIALDLAGGRRVTQTVLPSASSGYTFQRSLTDPSQVFLDAAGGDTFHSLVITVEDDALRAQPVGLEDEPFAGLSRDGAFLKLDVGGEWLSRYASGQADVSVDAEDVLPEGLRFVGYRPGFLDTDRVLAAVGKEQDSQDNRHLVLDGRTLQPVAEVDYPGTNCFDPLALGDGTWLTVEGDTVRRWRTA
ncbi:hypothetical protein [Streptomyces sp. NBC_00306]|uniref:hypothetical protein n=1 Tax=Streptomyces sp. NBC_00306 TaxID=2975708 RepID=UPI002E2DEFFF|nr:hypothetical protein [Streptomyces sp. NBC_00306]